MTIAALTMLLLVTALPSPSKLIAHTLTTTVHYGIHVLVLIILIWHKPIIIITLATVQSRLRVWSCIISMVTFSLLLVYIVRRISVELVFRHFTLLVVLVLTILIPMCYVMYSRTAMLSTILLPLLLSALYT